MIESINNCGRNRQISHAELQIICADPLSSRRSTTPYFLSVGCAWDFLPEHRVERKKKKSNFTVKKPSKHCVSQVIKVNINSDKSY